MIGFATELTFLNSTELSFHGFASRLLTPLSRFLSWRGREEEEQEQHADKCARERPPSAEEIEHLEKVTRASMAALRNDPDKLVDMITALHQIIALREGFDDNSQGNDASGAKLGNAFDEHVKDGKAFAAFSSIDLQKFACEDEIVVPSTIGRSNLAY